MAPSNNILFGHIKVQPERVFLRYWLSDGIALCTPATQTSVNGGYYVFDLRALGLILFMVPAY